MKRAELHELDLKFDLITLHHALEHIPNQLATLRGIHDRLSDDGGCLIRIAPSLFIGMGNLRRRLGGTRCTSTSLFALAYKHPTRRREGRIGTSRHILEFRFFRILWQRAVPKRYPAELRAIFLEEPLPKLIYRCGNGRF